MTARKRFGKPDRRCFDSLVVLTVWTVWNERNRRTFDNNVHGADGVVTMLLGDIGAWFQAGLGIGEEPR